jgi:hypothetical protein
VGNSKLAFQRKCIRPTRIHKEANSKYSKKNLENAKALRFDALIDTEMVNREMGTREKHQEMENHRII